MGENGNRCLNKSTHIFFISTPQADERIQQNIIVSLEQLICDHLWEQEYQCIIVPMVKNRGKYYEVIEWKTWNFNKYFAFSGTYDSNSCNLILFIPLRNITRSVEAFRQPFTYIFQNVDRKLFIFNAIISIIILNILKYRMCIHFVDRLFQIYAQFNA